MESHSIPSKSSCISVEESAVSPQNRPQMCNELVWELCKRIPTAKTSDSILLTANNMYVYLEPLFSKKLIYRDTIAFLKTLMNDKKDITIWIARKLQNKESEPIVVINNQGQLDGAAFRLATNHFRVLIQKRHYYVSQNRIDIFDRDVRYECAHLQYFLRLIAPLLQPIQLDLLSFRIPIDGLVRFLNTQSDWIDWIRLRDHHFDSEQIYGALSNYNKLEIYNSIDPATVPKLIQWLTSNNNNGKSKKYLFMNLDLFDEGLEPLLLIDELKKELVRATTKSRFVVYLELRQSLDEFTLCNELTGERLELRRKNVKGGRQTHALTRSPNNEFDNTGENCTEFDFQKMINISFT